MIDLNSSIKFGNVFLLCPTKFFISIKNWLSKSVFIFSQRLASFENESMLYRRWVLECLCAFKTFSYSLLNSLYLEKVSQRPFSSETKN